MGRILGSEWVEPLSAYSAIGKVLAQFFTCYRHPEPQASSVILFKRDRLQMIGVHTATHAAKVIDFQAFRNRAFEKFVGHAMAINYATIQPESRMAFERIAHPQPATGVWLWRNKVHEAIKQGKIRSRHVTSLGSMCLGLRILSRDVAARSYFTPIQQLGNAVQ